MLTKFHWGYRVGIFYLLFILGLIVFVLYSTTLKNDLVDKDYYNKGVNYQSQVDKLNRTFKNNIKPVVIIDKQLLRLIIPNLPDNKIKGTILFYRPDDETKDFKENFEGFDTIKYTLPLEKIGKGFWEIKTEFSINDSTYYYEDEFILE